MTIRPLPGRPPPLRLRALVEPQSSGLGGGAFLLHFDGRDVRAYDGRETAPAQANTALFLRPDGTPMAFFDAEVGGRRGRSGCSRRPMRGTAGCRGPGCSNRRSAWPSRVSVSPRQREALCHDFTARETPYRICGFPPPGSGAIAIAIGQILGMLEQTGAHRLPLAQGLPSTDWLHRYAEASRLAFADRARYVADPDFVDPPGGAWHRLLDPAYLAERARLIGPRAMASAPAGHSSSTTPPRRCTPCCSGT